MRPIVAGIGSLNEHLCEWVDFYLQSMVTRCLGYLQQKSGTRHADKVILEDRYCWSTSDIESLYTCIPLSDYSFI